MQGRGRFQVSATDKRCHLPQKRLNIQQASMMQQGLLSAASGVQQGDENDRKVILGICAMSKKSKSKPMSEIIQRLNDNFDRLQVYIFDEDTILNKPVEEWPIVNSLVSFFSHGFPLDKAIAYKDLRSPFIVNDLEMQYILQDRPKVYALMEKNNIPHPSYAVLDRDDPNCKFVETDDSIEVNGKLFMKPFVEKPVNAEDHNIYIYFPVAAGGGSTRLFRKVKDRSSVYSRFSRVRSTGSYLYEEFMPTDGTDVKVYTVGPDYQHAEARKSPALDGKVERDPDGKEIRYPVLLSNVEKMIARNVCKVFKQNVCGFDLLRASGKHFVCDVNGFSFVKTSSKYYDDCAKILGTLVMRACCPQLHIPYPMCTAPEDIPVVQTTSGSMMELRCVIGVIRHGDRTPKQKMKMEVKNKKFFDLFQKYGGYKSGHLKLKKPKQLQEVLDIVRHLLGEEGSTTDTEVEEKRAKLNQLKLVLEMYGHFSGINRKVQLKYQPTGRPKRSSSEEEDLSIKASQKSDTCSKGVHLGSKKSSKGLVLNSKDEDAPRDPSLVLILKWGGELTPAGRVQAENLGKAFRTLYPGGQGSNGQFEAPGLGFLRLHSTFRHDLKIYASDEGRVQMTAAAFTKGLLALEGELTPIVVQMVKSTNTNGLLDGEVSTPKYQMVVKEKLKGFFNQDREFAEEDYQKLAATNSISLVNAMQFVKNPFLMCTRVHEMIQEITARIRCLKMELKSRDLALFNGESWELLIRRWAKLEKDFRLKNGRFDISKIPDIYDCIKYDLQHNQKTLQFKRASELFMCSKALADIIIPQEYGITKEERLHIGQNYCTPLLMKIRSDLFQCINEPSTEESTTRLDSKYSNGVASPERFVRTRLYFTSESHIHSLLTMLRYGGLLDEEKDEQWKQSMDFIGACAELNYMSQIVLMMFEDPAKDIESDERFHIELHFSPGAYTSCDEIGHEPKGMGFRPKQNPVSGTSTPSILTETSEEPETPGSSLTPSTPDAHLNLKETIQPATKSAATSMLDVSGRAFPNGTSNDLVDSADFSVVDIDGVKPTVLPLSSVAGHAVRPGLRHCSSDPYQVRDLGELQEADLFSHELDMTRMEEAHRESQSDTAVFGTTKHLPKRRTLGQPRSPDPDTPEWDWGDDEDVIKEEDEEVDEDGTGGKDQRKNSLTRSQNINMASPMHKASRLSGRENEYKFPAGCSFSSDDDRLTSVSLPKTMESVLSQDASGMHFPHCPDTTLTPSSPTTNKCRRNHEEGGYFQLNKKERPVSFGCSCSKDDDSSILMLGIRNKTEPIEISGDPLKSGVEKERSRSLEDSVDSATMTDLDAYQRNYRTIHLPLGSDLVMKPLPTFFFYNQAPRALEGFNNVPLLHPLETLHNNLTFHQVDDFLGRVCGTKFPIPDVNALASLASKNNMNLAVGTSKDLPSSGNSSGGPNSPTAVSTPADLLKTLGMYIGMAKQGAESESQAKEPSEVPSDTGVAGPPPDLTNAALTGSYSITMDSNTSSCSLANKEHDQLKQQGQSHTEDRGHGEGQGLVAHGDEDSSGQVQLGAQDSLEECMAQVHRSGVR